MTDPNALTGEGRAADTPPVVSAVAGTHEPVARPDTSATAEALGGDASLPKRGHDPSTEQPGGASDPVPATSQGSPAPEGTP